jgi:UDP-2-acetamido-2,6-beta-L-arabino-hexul-4-ose reductase
MKKHTKETILITGGAGYIGSFLANCFKKKFQIIVIDDLSIGKKIQIRASKFYKFNLCNKKKLDIFFQKNNVDIIFHLAGVNRGVDRRYFFNNNYLLTKKICTILKSSKKKIRIIFSSSIHAGKSNFYGLSKQKSEKELLKLKKNKNISVIIYRLPNVFGKWSRPFYNSVIATYCYQLSRNKKIGIFSDQELKLLYIDDLIKDFFSAKKLKLDDIVDVVLFYLYLQNC